MSESLFNFILGIVTAFILMAYVSYVNKIKWQLTDTPGDYDDLTGTVNRVEVIDDTGRVYVSGSIYGTPVRVKLSFQDSDRTLKVFVNEIDKENKDELS